MTKNRKQPTAQGSPPSFCLQISRVCRASLTVVPVFGSAYYKRCPLKKFGSNDARLECAICKEICVSGDELRTLPCTHQYHTKCLDAWVQNKPTCPLCNESIDRLIKVCPPQFIRLLFLEFVLRAFARLNGIVSSSHELDCIMEQRSHQFESVLMKQTEDSSDYSESGPEKRSIHNKLLAEYLVHLESQKYKNIDPEHRATRLAALRVAGDNLARCPFKVRSGIDALTANISYISIKRANTVVLYILSFLR